MANEIIPAVEYRAMILEEYHKESLTALLDGKTRDIGDKGGVNEIQLKKIKTTGLGDYVRDGGFKAGKATIGWETVKLEQDRGIEFLLDRVDSMETLDTTIGDISKDFVDRHMVPELDAYRFAKYAGGAKTKKVVVLTKDNILTEIDIAMAALSDAYSPEEGRMLFVNSKLSPVLNAALPRQWSNEDGINRVTRNYNGLEVRYVPEVRFHELCELNSESAEMGFVSKGGSLNFLLFHPSAIWQAVKVNVPKFISADDPSNRIDSHIFNIRLFHDADVIKTYEGGVYANKAA
jgi:hypothetical protein